MLQRRFLRLHRNTDQPGEQPGRCLADRPASVIFSKFFILRWSSEGTSGGKILTDMNSDLIKGTSIFNLKKDLRNPKFYENFGERLEQQKVSFFIKFKLDEPLKMVLKTRYEPT